MERVTYEDMELGVKFRGVPDKTTLNIAFLTGGRLRAWTSAGETVVLPESEVLELLGVLLQRYPLDGLAAV